jgi:hypothetical protein
VGTKGLWLQGGSPHTRSKKIVLINFTDLTKGNLNICFNSAQTGVCMDKISHMVSQDCFEEVICKSA